MKALKAIAKNFNPAQYQEKEIVIDEFAKNIIDKVFDQLSVIFPAWRQAWKTDKDFNTAKMEWVKAFNENNINTIEQIKYGFSKARRSESDFLPSCGKFISWCTPSPEDMGYPSEYEALKQCEQYRANKKMFGANKSYARPLIMDLCKLVDWWFMSNNSKVKADKHFKDVYSGFIKSGYIEPEETDCERLETREVVRERMSDRQVEDGRNRGQEVIDDIKKKLKKNRYQGRE